MVARRGDIWWASLPEPAGSEPGYRRPVLVVQATPVTESLIRTVIIVTITSNTALATAPGNILLARNDSGLRRESVINVSQVATIDKSFLTDRIRALSPRIMERVDAGLKLLLAL